MVIHRTTDVNLPAPETWIIVLLLFLNEEDLQHELLWNWNLSCSQAIWDYVDHR